MLSSNYCFICGEKLTLKATATKSPLLGNSQGGSNSTSRYTDKGKIRLICGNTHCKVGCDNNGGHRYDGKNCVRCGRHSYLIDIDPEPQVNPRKRKKILGIF